MRVGTRVHDRARDEIRDLVLGQELEQLQIVLDPAAEVHPAHELTAGQGEEDTAEDGRGAAINVFFKPLSDVQYADLRLDDKIAADLTLWAGPPVLLP